MIPVPVKSHAPTYLLTLASECRIRTLLQIPGLPGSCYWRSDEKDTGVMPESFLEEVPLEPPWKSTDSGVKLKSVIGFCGLGKSFYSGSQ